MDAVTPSAALARHKPSVKSLYHDEDVAIAQLAAEKLIARRLSLSQKPCID